MSPRFVNRFIILEVSVLIVLTGLIAWPHISAQRASQQKNADLPKNIKDQASTFLATAIRPEFAKEIPIFTKQSNQPNQHGDVYLATWNTDGQFFSFLVGLTADNKAINYQRIWTMPLADGIDDKRASDALAKIFTSEFLTKIGSFTCKENTTGPTSLTECGGMKTDGDANLIGVTVRTPVELAPPPDTTIAPGITAPKVTIVSACFVPKLGTPVYTASLCI